MSTTFLSHNCVTHLLILPRIFSSAVKNVYLRVSCSKSKFILLHRVSGTILNSVRLQTSIPSPFSSTPSPLKSLQEIHRRRRLQEPSGKYLK
ncbi:hypothetical protein XELAEV_18003772mg [Xenopus laevis]|nr:hypothetical protein XELAEV_18003772mg [Xenopus laevis]